MSACYHMPCTQGNWLVSKGCEEWHKVHLEDNEHWFIAGVQTGANSVSVLYAKTCREVGWEEEFPAPLDAVADGLPQSFAAEDTMRQPAALWKWHLTASLAA